MPLGRRRGLLPLGLRHLRVERIAAANIFGNRRSFDRDRRQFVAQILPADLGTGQRLATPRRRQLGALHVVQ